ncbi:MAG: hypothetical protein PHV55_02560 [Candidatus Omnitrophica bacterium]|nr:hypothetical protein [Candidatus Omnitrophota bacterium]
MIKKLLLVLVSALAVFTAVAKEPSVKPYQPLNAADDLLEQKKEFARTVLKENGYLEILNIYKALREEDLSLCSTKKARNIAEELLALRYAGENRCGEIRNVLFQELCKTVNAQNCESIGGWKKNFCSAVSRNDPVLLARSAGNDEFAKAGKMPVALVNKNTSLFALGIYYGFKHYNTMACERFIRGAQLPLSWKASCRMLFSQDFQKESDEIVDDLSFFILAREINPPDKSLCDTIHDKALKDACFDGKVQALIDVW